MTDFTEVAPTKCCFLATSNKGTSTWTIVIMVVSSSKIRHSIELAMMWGGSERSAGNAIIELSVVLYIPLFFNTMLFVGIRFKSY